MARKKNNDLPTSVVAAVLVITVIVSVLGTLVFMNELSKVRVAQAGPSANSLSSSGKVSLTVGKVGGDNPQAVSSATGNIALSIAKLKGGR